MRVSVFLVSLLLSLSAHAELQVIAHPQVPINSLSVEDLSLIYLIQKTSWGNGVAVVPVNREASSPVREHFSETLFNRSPSDLSEYWNRLRFTGKTPPLVQTSDQAVLGFVHNVPGAIGYIDSGVAPVGVKVLLKLP